MLFTSLGAERYVDKEHISIRVKGSTAKEYRRNLDRFIVPALGQLTVTGTTCRVALNCEMGNSTKSTAVLCP